MSRGDALLQRKLGEQLVVPLDSLYVYRRMVDWSPKWRCHGWRTPSGEARHRDLWEQILWEQERAGAYLQIRCVPSHLGVEGNVGADWLAEQGRQAHPNHSRLLLKRPWTEPQWEALGLVEMCSDEEEAQGSGHSSEQESMCSESLSLGAGMLSLGFSVSDTRRLSSGVSTDVSDTWRVKQIQGGQG